MSGDFTAVRSYIYTAGAIIFAARHNTNETAIYTGHNNAFNETTGHQHTGSTGDAPKLTSAGLDLTVPYAWTGAHSWTTTLTLNSGADLKIYSDVATTLKFQVDGATGNTGIAALGKMFFDGADLAGNTYIQEASADNLHIVVGGSERIAFTNTLISVNGGTNFTIAPTNKFFFDGGGDTYMSESIANVITVRTGGVDTFQLQNGFVEVIASDFSIPSTKKLHFDGSSAGDTYMSESIANVITIRTGGVDVFQMQNGYVEVAASDFGIPATKKFHLDGSSAGNTYIFEDSGDSVSHVAGGNTSFKVTTSTVQTLTDAYLSATKKQFYDGGGDTYTYESSANVLDTYVGGANILKMSATQLTTLAISCNSMTAGTTSTDGTDFKVASGKYRLGFANNSYIDYYTDDADNHEGFKFTGKSGGGTYEALRVNNLGLSMDSGSNYWNDHGGYTAGAPGITGYVPVTVNGVTYKFSVST